MTIGFEAGKPVSLNGKKLAGVALLEAAEPRLAASTASGASIWWRTVLSA